MELNKIYNQDCLETMGDMPDGFIDLTITSMGLMLEFLLKEGIVK